MKKRRINLNDEEICQICMSTDCNKNKCMIALDGEGFINGDCLGMDPIECFDEDWLNEEVEIEEGNK